MDGWKADDDHEASERGGIIQTERGGREERGGFVTDLLEAVLRSLDVTAADSLEGNWNSTTIW